MTRGDSFAAPQRPFPRALSGQQPQLHI